MPFPEPFVRLKQYAHFDAPLPRNKIEALVSDPTNVSKHAFFPMIYYWEVRRPLDNTKQTKFRKIRYAARADAYIYSYYRKILAEKYELLLKESGVSDNVIAYRKIRSPDNSGRGLCNIHFAANIFDFIESLGNCVVICLDVSDFFESLDHARLKKTWCRILGMERLPKDHFAVYKNITSYSEINRDHLYVRFGLLKYDCNGRPLYKYSKKNMPKQICIPSEFRKVLKEQGGSVSGLIEHNKCGYGIPQGSPISDLLANAYLLDFDCHLASYAKKRGGLYRRYSDDIIIVLPGDGRAGRGAREYASRLIHEYGEQMKIKSEKTYVVRFMREDGGAQVPRLVWAGRKQKRIDGIEYLGFRFDGKHIYIRDSTLSQLNGRIKKSVKSEVRKLIKRYDGKDYEFIKNQFSFSKFIQRYGRVEDFEGNPDYRNLTFWSYARRAAAVFGRRRERIFRQLKNQKAVVRKWIDAELRKQLAKKKAGSGCNPAPPGL